MVKTTGGGERGGSRTIECRSATGNGCVYGRSVPARGEAPGGRGERGAPLSGAGADGRSAERRLDELFGTARTLAVYGTLAPGRPNHHVLAPLGGEWADGLIEGDLLQVGWGAALGYPGFRPRAGGDAVAVKVLTAPALVTAWPDLDRFEGPGYERILVPVFGSDPGFGRAGERRVRTVANLYAAAEDGPGADAP